MGWHEGGWGGVREVGEIDVTVMISISMRDGRIEGIDEYALFSHLLILLPLI